MTFLYPFFVPCGGVEYKYKQEKSKEKLWREMFMSKFDMIIGYTGIKRELQQIADILKNCEAYEKLNISPPRGLLLHGEPGVGKSLMASAIIEASERSVFVCRKDKPNGDFVKEIKAVFGKAVANEPSIVYLDDLDKFANSDEDHRDAEEYVTVQSCIDEVKEKGVFVLATVNNIRCLPRSLYRAGRFDRVIKIRAPRGKDAIKIITHYLSEKKVVEGVDVETIARIMNGRSCAELENVINAAGIRAGYERAESITMEHFMEACLRAVFNLPTFPESKVSDDNVHALLSDFNNDISRLVYHEAGHVVVSEILCPKSVNFAYAYNDDEERGGITNYYNDGTYTSLYWEKSRIISSLGGRPALEQKYRICDMGGESNLEIKRLKEQRFLF